MDLGERLQNLLARYQHLEGLLGDAEAPARPEYSTWLKEHGRLRKLARPAQELTRTEAELAEAKALLEDRQADAELRALAAEEVERLAALREQLRQRLAELCAATDEAAAANAVFEIHAGVGGDEAALWAGDLFDMYRRYFDRQGWKVKVTSADPGNVGGFKEICLVVEGEGAYGKLRHEAGGHRVQRVPQTETQGRLHTSAAKVTVFPEMGDVEVQLNEEDLEISFTHSQGPGGQSVNTTDSAVRVLHQPTGLQVKCQESKSQHRNRARAIQILKAKLLEREREKRERELAGVRAGAGSGDRSERIRTYNFPQNRVSDHRLEGEEKNWELNRILQGDLEELITQVARKLGGREP